MAFFPSLISFSSLPAIDNLEINTKISSLTLFYSATLEYPQQINMGQIKTEPTENIKPDPICNGAYILPLNAPTFFFDSRSSRTLSRRCQSPRPASCPTISHPPAPTPTKLSRLRQSIPKPQEYHRQEPQR